MQLNLGRIGIPLAIRSPKIGTKIFALVVFCLALLALVSGVTIWQMKKISVEISDIAQREIPLSEALSEITIHQLEQEIQFERALRFGEAMFEHGGTRKKFDISVGSFKKFTAEIEAEFSEVKVIARRALDAAISADKRKEYQGVLKMLEILGKEHSDYDELSRKTFELIAAGNQQQALALLPRIEAEEADVDRQLVSMLREVGSFTQRSVKRVEQHENFALNLLVVLTDIALVAGTLAAVFMVRRAVLLPLKEIVTGLDALSAGDMSVRVKVHSDDEIGSVARACEVFRNALIKLRKNEADLRDSQLRFRDIVEVSSDWVWESDKDMRFTYLSGRFEEVTGLSAKLVLGKTRIEITEGNKADWDVHLADLAARRPFREFRHTVKNEKGEKRHLMISGTPVFNTAGFFEGYRGTGSDRTSEIRDQNELINHRNHLQAMVNIATGELKEALAKEKKLNKLQRDFVSMASHEFRTPLTIIDGVAQRIKSRANKNRLTPEDAIERVEKIRAAVKRMVRLMDSTLAAARMQDGKIEIDIQPCDIGPLVREVCERQQEVIETHIISCDLAGAPLTIQADSGSVEQMLANLLSNAIKYAPEAPDIEVTARTQGDQVAISVRDHGVGIDADDLGRIGERFFRAKTSTGTAGTGIGLNLVNTLAELHGGSLKLESVKGEGSTFTLSLPVAGPEQTEQVETKVA